MKFINKEGKVFDTIKVADDDYTFTVKLCDNEIDDDNERFSSQCLKQMAEMFVGKYGCIGETRIAKIVSTEIVTDDNKWATLHERYQWLKATVIIPRSNETEWLIEQIEYGEKPEISVACSVNTSACSICGKTNRSCTHKPGEYYDGKLCYMTLYYPQEVFEWAFVEPTKTVEKETSMDNHIGDTTEMMRPRICEVLGVEVGEWFTYPGMSTSFQVTENGFLKCADGDLKTCVPTLVNHPDRIIHKPHFAEYEIVQAENLLDVLGDGELKRVGDMTTLRVDGKIIYLKRSAFPSLKPEQSIKLSELADLAL